MKYTFVPTPFGLWPLVSENNAIVAFGAKLPLKKWNAVRSDEEPILKNAALQIAEYFAGDRKSFTFKIDFKWGTDFQRKAWNALLKIPYGKTWSYKTQAEFLKSEKAFRAVGSANGKNPLCILVPCHRVVAADGSLGGYSGGLHVKKHLLALESQ